MGRGILGSDGTLKGTHGFVFQTHGTSGGVGVDGTSGVCGGWGLLDDYRGHENVADSFHGIPLRHTAGQRNLEH